MLTDYPRSCTPVLVQWLPNGRAMIATSFFLVFLVVPLSLAVINFIFHMSRRAEFSNLLGFADSKLCAVNVLLVCLSGHDVRAPATNPVSLLAGFVYATKYSNFAGVYCLVKFMINALRNLEHANKHCGFVHCLKKSECNSCREHGQVGAMLGFIF